MTGHKHRTNWILNALVRTRPPQLQDPELFRMLIEFCDNVHPTINEKFAMIDKVINTLLEKTCDSLSRDWLEDLKYYLIMLAHGHTSITSSCTVCEIVEKYSNALPLKK